MGLVWGIDLGGTKVEGVVLDPDRFTEPRCRLRVPTEANRGYDHIISQIGRLLTEMERETGEARPEAIGIGTPGTSDPATGLMKNCNTTAFNGRPLSMDLERALGCRVALANDANCFALAEARLGAGRGAEVVFGVILGTGVGGGLVVNGRVLGGAQGIAGEWGHNLLEPDGAPCYCGRKGCVETVLAGPSLERFYAERSGERRRLPEILSRVDTDAAAAATRERLMDQFGRALAVVVNIVDPHVVVLGGGVGSVPELRTEGRESLARHVFNTTLATELKAPTLGDSAGVFGAAMLVAP
jgi:predicted NBD/HSP70 family sugar kinase